MITEVEMILRIMVAVVLGAVVGYDRERQHQPAGLRTHMVLVAGATLAMTLSINLAMQFRALVPNGDPARLAAQVLAGIGFLCAGAILREGPTVKGLTTATSLWTMAVVGLAIGAGYYLTGVVITALLLVILAVLNVVEARLIKQFISVRFTVLAIDRSGVEQQVRGIFVEAGDTIENFQTDRHIRQQRIKMTWAVRLKPGTQAEILSERLATIKGVRIVKYE